MLLFLIQFYLFLNVHSSLINHWSFDGDMKKDAIGTADLYDAVNASLTEDRFNKSKSALRLNDGYIKIPSGVYFAGDFTITSWVKANSARHFARILEFGNGAYSDNVELSFKDTSYYIHVKTWFLSDTKGFLESSSALKPNEWTYVTAVLSGGITKLYYNAVLVASGTQFSPRHVIRESNYIGKGTFPGDQNADAIYDEIKIFDDALNEYQIKEDAGISKNGLLYYWSFDGYISSNITDKSELIKVVNATFTKDRFQKLNSAVRLDNGYIQATSGIYFDEFLTITAWVKFNSEFEDVADVLYFSGENNFEAVLSIDKNEIYFSLSQAEDSIFFIKSPIKFTLDWTHIAVVLTDESIKLYYNGSLKAFSQVKKISRFATLIYMGRTHSHRVNSSISLDEIKIFDRALTLNEIENESDANKSDLIHYWSFDEVIRDEISNSRITESLNAYHATGRLGNSNSAIKLNNGYFKIPNGVYFQGDFTITAWVKLNSVRYYARLLDIGNGQGADNVILSIYCETSTYVGFWVINDQNHSLLKSKTQLKIDKWTHISAVLNGTEASIYINGILDSKGPMLIPRNVTRTSNYIGKSNWGHDQNADATFDEIKIYNRALSAFKIADNARTNNLISDNSVLDTSNGHGWSFSGDTKDGFGNEYLFDGFNAYLTEDRFGRSKSAVQLENGYFKVPTNVYFSNKFTICAWIKINSFRFNSRIIDFGDGIDDNVAIGFDELTGFIKFFIFHQSGKSEIRSNVSISLNEWTHVAISFLKGTAKLYINGLLDTTGPLYIPRNVIRTTNFIGKSNWDSHKNAHAVYDEIFICTDALSPYHIKMRMDQDQPNKVKTELNIRNLILVVTLILITAFVILIFGYFIFKKNIILWFRKSNDTQSQFTLLDQ